MMTTPPRLRGTAAILTILSLTATTASADDKTTEVKIKSVTLTVPAAWKKTKPANNLRNAQFEVPVAKGDSEPGVFYVSYFGGGGGGVDANIGRWVSQFGSVDRKANVTQGESPQGKYVFVEITGTFNKPIGPPIRRQTKPAPGYSMLGVILTVPDKGNYFLKMTGPDKTVAAAAKALRASFGAVKEKETAYDQ